MTDESAPVPEHAQTHTPLALAEAIAGVVGGAMRPPTPEQTAVIEADPTRAALVVAGAGSGKTETMANRVLWLLANGHAAPAEILGLTFTRKAAGELGVRIRSRIAQLREAGLLTAQQDAAELDEFDVPEVSTYNAFANGLFREYAALVGRDGDSVLLGDAAAWQLARTVVIESTDERLVGIERALDSIVQAVLDLAHAMNENVVTSDQVRELAADTAALADLPLGDRFERADVVGRLASVGALAVLADLADEFERRKIERGLVEFSDQVALALRIVRQSPTVRDELRARHRFVLLDEYQDTSVVQTWLLSELFGGTPVMAVGDPHQSIYGWRGASSANLAEFARRFGASDAAFSLSTSWRNGTRVLDVANEIVVPLRAGERVGVESLRPGPAASDRPVDVAFLETVEQEAEHVAGWLRDRLAEGGSAALLFRARATQPLFLAALRRHGVPYHVLGVGGLLDEPEIADLVCALRVLDDPAAGEELVRLLAGSRWRLGARDIWLLGRVASWLRDRDYSTRPLPDAVKELLRASVAQGEGGSLVEALDFVAHAPDDHVMLQAFSPDGITRLRDAGRVLRRLRGRVGMDLLDLVALVVQDFALDVEVAANETRTAGSANLDAFTDALAGYVAVADQATLSGFLAWLRVASRREDLLPRPEDPEPGTVQVLTIHASKGLEWDHVAVPRLVAGELPTTPRQGWGWLAFGELPYPLKGDADDLPRLELAGVEDRKQLQAAMRDFQAAVAAHHEDEERRLAYVAVTRSARSLLLTGAFWASQRKPRVPSPFLAELAQAGLVTDLPAAPANEENPREVLVDELSWPLDPLGSRRAAVERAAALVRDAAPSVPGGEGEELALLLAERRERLAPLSRVPLPTRISASRFKDYVTEPAEVARQLRRPMPERPYRATRLGTLFHSWVEHRYGLGGTGDELDALLAGEDGEIVDAERLAELQAVFARSPWGERRPIDVEREIHLVLDGQVVVCKIDAVYELPGEHADADASVEAGARAEPGRTRYEIVDWKTGKAPKDADDLEAKQFQLALYRLAYARWRGVDPADIDAVFYFVAEGPKGTIVRPDRIFDEAELVARWRSGALV